MTAKQTNPADDTARATLQEALDNLEQQAIDWHEECKTDLERDGQILGDGKELRRARKWVETAIDRYSSERATAREAELFQQFEAIVGDNYPDIKIVDGVENDPTVLRAINYEKTAQRQALARLEQERRL